MRGIFSFILAGAVLLSGCDSDSPSDAGTPSDAGETSDGGGDAGIGDGDAGAGDLDAGIGDVDAGAGDLDAGIGDGDAGAGDLDAGTGDLDAGTGDLDAGDVDAGGGGVDAGFDGGSDAGRPDAGFDAGRPDAGPPSRVFVTELSYQGDLGGVSGADLQCNLAATRAGLSGTWVAWVSKGYRLPNENALDHVSDASPWYTLDGRLAFATHAELAGVPRTGIDRTASGMTLTSGYVWTGTLLGGRRSSRTCVDWNTSSSSPGISGENRAVAGIVGATDVSWTNDPAGVRACNELSHLICFEQ